MKKTSFIFLSIICLSLLLNGCGGDSGSDPSGDSDDLITDVDSSSPVVATPSIISVSLDAARSVSGGINPQEGGTITATGSDGAIYSLLIPPDALDAPQTITLTPVSGITDLPLSGGLTAAVDLLPNGLRFFQPATLTITPPSGVSIPDVIAFGYQDDEFYLYPVTKIDTTNITLNLIHFSGYGVGTGTSSDVADQMNRSTNSAENNARQKMSDIMTELAKRQSSNPNANLDADDLDALTLIYRDWYNNFIKPKLIDATTDETLLDSALKDFNGWRVIVDSFGLGTVYLYNEVFEGIELGLTGIDNAIDIYYTKCKDDHDLMQIPVMLGWESEATLLALWERDSRPTLEKMDKCATFELEFTSKIDWDYGYYTTSSTVNAQVPLTYAPGMLEFNGSGTLFYPEFTFTYTGIGITTGCQVESTIHPDGALDVPYMHMEFKSDTPLSDITMIIEPSYLDEIINLNCIDGLGDSFSYQDSGYNYWSFGFEVLRGAMDGIEFGSIVIRDWNVTGGEIYAEKSLSGTWSEGGITVFENTTLKIIHTPR